MVIGKKFLNIFTLCCLTTLLFSCYMTTKVKLKETPLDLQTSESKQKTASAFSIQRSVVEIEPESKASSQNGEGRPQISFDSTQFDFGEVWEGKNILHSFTVKNTGTAMLNIKSVKPG